MKEEYINDALLRKCIRKSNFFIFFELQKDFSISKNARLLEAINPRASLFIQNRTEIILCSSDIQTSFDIPTHLSLA